MEPLWSPVVATGGNHWQIGSARQLQEQAKTVATGCDQLRKRAHGKEGVDGSSPSEGSAKGQQMASSIAGTPDARRPVARKPVPQDLSPASTPPRILGLNRRHQTTKLSAEHLSVQKLVSRPSGYWSRVKAARFGPIGMEQLWNRGGATGGKRSALRSAENGLI